MQNSTPHRPLELSHKLYERLLAAYPRSHREEYGGAMAQLFRDQCRDAWNNRRTLGLAALWLRILPDLIKTSFLERCSTFNPGKYMADKFNAVFNPRSPAFAFWAVFIIVFFVIFSTTVVITFLLPESYASTCRIKVEPEMITGNDVGQIPSNPAYDPYFIQTTFEIIQSQVVLSNVVNRLNLNVAWGKKYFAGETLQTTETMELLKRRMELKPVRNTKLVAITVYSDDRKEAAQLANAVAEAYQKYRLDLRHQLMLGGFKALEEQKVESEAKIQAASTNVDYLRTKFQIQDKIRDNDPETVTPAPTLSEQMLQTYNQQIIESQKVYQQLQTQLDELKKLDRDKLRDVLPTVTGDSMLADLLTKLHAAEQTRGALTNQYAASEMHVVQIQSTIDVLQRQIDARVDGIMAGLDSEVVSKKASLDALVASIDQAKANDQQEEEREQPYWAAKRELKSLLDFNKVLTAKIEEEKLYLEIPANSMVQIVDTAVPGNAPVKPNKPLNLAIGAIIGAFVGGVSGSIAAFIAMRMGKRRNATAV